MKTKFMMQIKFNFNNLVFYGVSSAAWQCASVIRRRRWRLWLAYCDITLAISGVFYPKFGKIRLRL